MVRSVNFIFGVLLCRKNDSYFSLSRNWLFTKIRLLFLSLDALLFESRFVHTNIWILHKVSCNKRMFLNSLVSIENKKRIKFLVLLTIQLSTNVFDVKIRLVEMAQSNSHTCLLILFLVFFNWQQHLSHLLYTLNTSSINQSILRFWYS